MNHNTLTHIFTKGLHLFFIVRLGATLIGGWGIFSGASPVWANTTVSIIDTLELFLNKIERSSKAQHRCQ